jgi:hypothetical protein
MKLIPTDKFYRFQLAVLEIVAIRALLMVM